MKNVQTKRSTKAGAIFALIFAAILALSLSACSASEVEPDYVPQELESTVPAQETESQDVQAEEPALQTGNIHLPDNIVPRSPRSLGGPENPAISAQRAAELARDHLVSEGITEARFDYIYMDREHGTWVWSVEFDGPGLSYEFYIDVQTGAIVDFVIDR